VTSLLLLAQELFERAANPAYGVAINDEHSFRLAAALGPEDVERFASEVARLDDPSTLTSYGWAWVLEFVVGHGIALDGELLTELCQRWDEPALKALVIEAAMEPDGSQRLRPSQDEWLAGVIDRAAPLPVAVDDRLDDDRQIDDDQVALPGAIDTSSAEALLTALLIVGTDAAIASARQLLERRWPGGERLARFVTDRVNDPDPLGRVPWTALRS
jgi:hypothetical protein